tara:strand:- start:15761 stop:16342 length:582 start_codon:yes stop_codon:yes gene_type:complete
MIFDIRNMLILTIKNLIKRMIYNKKKLSHFEELGYSNVVNISKYLCYSDTFSCLANINSIVNNYISKSCKTLKRKVDLQKKIIDSVLYHATYGLHSNLSSSNNLYEKYLKLYKTPKTNNDYLYLSENFEELSKILPCYMYILLTAHDKLHNLLKDNMKNRNNIEKRSVRIIYYSGCESNFNKSYMLYKNVEYN